MAHYRYLIIGGGMTADAAVKGIREVDAQGSIGLMSAEKDAPYDRPPLTKGLWKGKPKEKIWRNTPTAGVELHLGRTAKTLDPKAQSVTDDQGTTHTYDKLLLATGGTPTHLPFGGDDIVYYRTLADYEHLRAMTEQGERFAVLGGGFIGSEIAAALSMVGKKVVMLFPEEGIGARLFPADLSHFVNDYYVGKGVEVLTGELVSAIEKQDGKFTVKTKAGGWMKVDGVIAGLGIKPNVELAQAAGLKVENGIVINDLMQTSDPNIYAAGDVANFQNPTLGMRMRVEHEDNANTMGKQVGQTMAGKATPYTHLPYFYSDLFELGYEAVGELDPRLETVADWKEPFRKGVVYYLKDGRVRGALLWDVWGQVDAARALIAEKGPFNASNLKGKIPVS